MDPKDPRGAYEYSHQQWLMAEYTSVNCDIAALQLLRAECVMNMSVDQKFLQDAANPFHLPKSIFCNIFRLSQEMVLQIIETIRNKDDSPDPMGVPIQRQVLITLLVYANGKYEQWPTDWNSGPEISKPDVIKIVRRVTMAISNHMLHFVKFPITPEERKASIKAFQTAKNPFPGALGVMDAFHVKITEPAFQSWAFLNQRNYYSLNVQLVCDSDHKIIYVNPRYPGASRDNIVWTSSVAQTNMRASYVGGERSTWLLGDCHYGLQPWLMTPERGTLPGTPEARYNEAHTKTWGVVEETISALRGTWRLLSLHKPIDYEPVVVANMVNVCCIMHNMRCAANVPLIMEESFELGRNRKKRPSKPLLLAAKEPRLENSQSEFATPLPTNETVQNVPNVTRHESVAVQHGSNAVSSAADGVDAQVQNGHGGPSPVCLEAVDIVSGMFDISDDGASTELRDAFHQTENELRNEGNAETHSETVNAMEARVHLEPRSASCELAKSHVQTKAPIPARILLFNNRANIIDDNNISKRKDELAVAKHIRAGLIARYFGENVSSLSYAQVNE